jgi:hypothetical protein
MDTRAKLVGRIGAARISYQDDVTPVPFASSLSDCPDDAARFINPPGHLLAGNGFQEMMLRQQRVELKSRYLLDCQVRLSSPKQYFTTSRGALSVGDSPKSSVGENTTPSTAVARLLIFYPQLPPENSASILLSWFAGFARR